VLAHTQQIFNQPKLSTRLSKSELKTNQLKDKQKQTETDDTQCTIKHTGHETHTQLILSH